MEDFSANTQIHGYTMRFLLLFLAIVWTGLALGQRYQPHKKAVKWVEKGREELRERHFKEAEELFLKAKDKDPGYSLPYFSLIRLYLRLGNGQKLDAIRKQYVTNIPPERLNPSIINGVAKNEIARGNYSEASQYLSTINEPDTLLLQTVAFAKEQLAQPANALKLDELPAAINKFDYQYLPVLTIDGSTLIYTARENWSTDEDLVWSFRTEEGWTEAVSVSSKINSRHNEGACTISADGRTLVFTSCEGRKSFGNCDLYMAKREGEDWSEPYNIGDAVNSGSWDSQPALSADGRTLYFVSTRPGGQGGKDIWVSHFNNNKWSEAENLGAMINTPGDESTPFIHFDNRSLFFASNGRVGMGGFDLFVSQKDSVWGEPENLGYPLNTYHDETSLFVDTRGDKGFFAKERKSNGRLVSSRLVRFNAKEIITLKPVNYITGKVVHLHTREPLKASLEIVDLSSGDKMYVTESDSVTGQYFLALPPADHYGAFIDKEGFLFEDIAFENTSLQTDTVDIALQPLEKGAKIVLENIYFDFDSDKLSPNSKEELNRVAALLKKYPNVNIQISGHTDSQGTFDYNMDLSTRRAKRVYLYLINQKINPERLSYKGFADKQPIEKATKSALNRRIELKVQKF